MLNIYCADAFTDIEKFIFDRVDPAKKTILLVPDQYSLQAERAALELGGQKALLELMVTDFNALGHKVVHELEGHDPKIIDKYGRHMLLSVLIERMEGELTVLRGRKGRRGGNALADQMNTMISELKRYEIGPEKLEEVIGRLREESRDRPRSGESYLVLKLEDLLRVYRAYEEAISGIYQDSEDYISYYAGRIPKSELVRGADIWIYGFDSFTPKNFLVIGKLLETAGRVSVIMMHEAANGQERAESGYVRSLTGGSGTGLFRLTELMMQRLEEAAEEAGMEHRRESIPAQEYLRRSIWTPETGSGGEHDCGPEGTGGKRTDMLRERIRLVRASGTYEEGESAAAFIQNLVRDEGFRYGDIAVICNDMDGRGRALRRAFDRWDIPAFADQKRKVLHQPVIGFLLSFLEVLVSGFNGDGIIGMIKSGMMSWSTEEEELLENYMTEFRIRGKRWRQPFIWDGDRYTDDQIRRLNEMRAFLVTVCDQARDSIGKRNTAGEKIRGLTAFLEDRFQIRDRIGMVIEQQTERRLLEGAAETAQIWNRLCGIFEQIEQIIGEEKISNVLLKDMITAGVDSLEIGLVPASRDCVLIGTLQRSRPGRVRALVVTGANAGILPLETDEEGLLSRPEKERLEKMDLEFAGRRKIAQMEEQLAIYRMFSLPGGYLYVSCGQSDDDGSMLRPSEVFSGLQRWQPEIAGDLDERPLKERIGSRRATVPYLAQALREEGKPGSWSPVLDWFEENDPRQIRKLLRGLQFNNHREALGEDLADALYRGDREAINASASRLEKFSGCPFAHFIQYGLGAWEQRTFEVGGREIGDIYHRCLMEFSRQLQAPGEPTWQSVTEEECRRRVGRILESDSEGYREGLFASDEYSKFRLQRIAEICGDIAWAVVTQVRQGKIRQMYFEEPFGRTQTRRAREGLQIPAVEVTADGRKVRISGVIDRIDLIDAGDDQPCAVRIVDYKSGKNTIRMEDFESGYKLQLMVYMNAVTGQSAGEESGLVPAGVFYFKIHDFIIDGDKKPDLPDPTDPDDLRRRMRMGYRMEGIVVNDADLIGGMDIHAEGSSGMESSVIPVKYDPKKEAFRKVSGGILLDREEFRQLMEMTGRQVERICGELVRGEIDAVPKREKGKDIEGKRRSACTYCGFRSICGFDTAIRGCRYEDV